MLYRDGLGRVRSSCIISSFEAVCSADKCSVLKFPATRVLRSYAIQTLTALWSSSVQCCTMLCNGDDAFYYANQGYLHYVGTVWHFSALSCGRLWLLKREIRGGRLSCTNRRDVVVAVLSVSSAVTSSLSILILWLESRQPSRVSQQVPRHHAPHVMSVVGGGNG